MFIRARCWSVILCARDASFLQGDKLGVASLHGSNDGLFGEEKPGLADTQTAVFKNN